MESNGRGRTFTQRALVGKTVEADTDTGPTGEQAIRGGRGKDGTHEKSKNIDGLIKKWRRNTGETEKSDTNPWRNTCARRTEKGWAARAPTKKMKNTMNRLRIIIVSPTLGAQERENGK